MLVCRQSYGHGNNKTGGEKKSILHPDLKTIPRQPQVQVIGNGTIYDYEGLAVRPPQLLVASDSQADHAKHFALQEAKLKHPHHKTFHKTVVSPEDEAAGITRFYRWHIDAALVRPSLPSQLDYNLLIRLLVVCFLSTTCVLPRSPRSTRFKFRRERSRLCDVRSLSFPCQPTSISSLADLHPSSNSRR